MAEVFTYFRQDGRSEVRTQPEGPSPLEGEVWVRGQYARPIAPSPLNVRVGKSGIKARMVIEWLKLSDNDIDSLLEGYCGVLTRAEVESALWYYKKHQDAIDRRIEEEMQPA